MGSITEYGSFEMSVHSTYYEDEEEYERDLRFEYRKEQYEQDHGIHDLGDYPDQIPNQYDNLTGSMNL